MDKYIDIKENIEEIRKTTDGKATLLLATKCVDADRINYAISCGITHIGENKVNELLEKYEKIDRDKVELHFIGHLQRNKVKYIVDKVDMIQSVDSIRLAEEIEKECAKKNITMPILAEINVGYEESKSGIAPEETEDFLLSLSKYPHLKVKGLMAIPPASDDKNIIIENFKKMSQIYLDIKNKMLDNIDMDILSIGMSDDYKEAVMNGSTMVRIGSRVFGRRNYNV
ncbi:MAG: YggS family pyridoxal phosphate-dependent enzyme [Ruminococcaceae bacterium]|nr:YggS family pyridoxal phosphate-dependent enzyme [Oscillospiraceae bacterium]